MKTTVKMIIAILVILMIGTSCEGTKKTSKVKTVSYSKMKRVDRKMAKIYISPAGRSVHKTGPAKLPFCASLGVRR